MIKHSKCMVIALLILFVLLLSACKDAKAEQEMGGLVVNSMNTSMGSTDGNSLDETRFTYEIDLTNNEKTDVYISTAQVVVNETVKSRILSKNNTLPLNKTLKPGETVAIKGSLIFDTKGLSKEDITKLEPFIKDLEITREQTINLLQKKD